MPQTGGYVLEVWGYHVPTHWSYAGTSNAWTAWDPGFAGFAPDVVVVVDDASDWDDDVFDRNVAATPRWRYWLGASSTPSALSIVDADDASTGEPGSGRSSIAGCTLSSTDIDDTLATGATRTTTCTTNLVQYAHENAPGVFVSDTPTITWRVVFVP